MTEPIPQPAENIAEMIHDQLEEELTRVVYQMDALARKRDMGALLAAMDAVEPERLSTPSRSRQ